MSCAYKLCPRFVMTRLGGEAVVAPICDSTVDMGQIMSLNATGADVLEGIENGLAEEEIVAKMTKRNPETPEDVVRNGVKSFIDQMVEMGLVEKIEL